MEWRELDADRDIMPTQTPGFLKSKPSPQPNKIYGGPDVPLVYDSNWQYFTNLTPAQIAWFQAQPEWRNFTSWVALSPAAATLNANVSPAEITAALSAAALAANIKG